MSGSRGRVVALTVMGAVLALAIGLSLRLRLPTGKAEAIGPAEAPPSVTSPPEGMPRPEGPGALTQTVNGIAVSAANLRRVGNRVQADVCFALPDDGDWLIHEAALRHTTGGVATETSDFSGMPIEVKSPPVDGQQRTMRLVAGEKVVSWQPAAEGQAGSRCDTLTFVVQAEADLSTVTLAIRAIGAFPREGEVCTTYLAKVQRVLDARGAGIRVGCDRHEWGDQLAVVGKPAAMSQAEAESLLLNEEFYTVNGPWLFTASLQPGGP